PDRRPEDHLGDDATLSPSLRGVWVEVRCPGPGAGPRPGVPLLWRGRPPGLDHLARDHPTRRLGPLPRGPGLLEGLGRQGAEATVSTVNPTLDQILFEIDYPEKAELLEQLVRRGRALALTAVEAE